MLNMLIKMFGSCVTMCSTLTCFPLLYRERTPITVLAYLEQEAAKKLKKHC
jgi:hypothetical protein